jgi:histidinol-phosphate aminotransferase
MTAHVRDRVRALRPYVPGDQPVVAADTLKLNTNESPYPPSPRVAEALRAVADGALNLYPDGDCTELRRALAARHGFPVEGVCVGNGSAEILRLCIRAFTQEGQAVGFLDPSYTLYAALAEAEGLRPAPLALEPDFTWRAPARPEPGLFILANPNSPTGRLAEPDTLARFFDAFPGVVLLDEAYVEFSARDALDLARPRANVIVSRTLSKAYSLANARVGYALGRPALIEALFRIKDSYNVSGLDQAAALAAVGDEAYLREAVRRVRATRAAFSAALAARGFEVVPSEANFIFARPTRLAAGALFEALRSRRIYVRYFNTPACRNHLRFTLGTDDQMARVLAAIDALQAPAAP